MNETQERLLTEKHVLILPQNVNHDTYEYVLEALLLHPEPLKMYCKGGGGNVAAGMAIVDLITEHGLITGLLPGEADSTHVTIFAACSTRYIYPHSNIGVHSVAWVDVEGRQDAHSLALLSEDFRASDKLFASVLARASNLTEAEWLAVLTVTGSGHVRRYNADEIIKMGLATYLPRVGGWFDRPGIITVRPEFNGKQKTVAQG